MWPHPRFTTTYLTTPTFSKATPPTRPPAFCSPTRKMLTRGHAPLAANHAPFLQATPICKRNPGACRMWPRPQGQTTPAFPKPRPIPVDHAPFHWTPHKAARPGHAPTTNHAPSLPKPRPPPCHTHREDPPPPTIKGRLSDPPSQLMGQPCRPHSQPRCGVLLRDPPSGPQPTAPSPVPPAPHLPPSHTHREDHRICPPPQLKGGSVTPSPLMGQPCRPHSQPRCGV